MDKSVIMKKEEFKISTVLINQATGEILEKGVFKSYEEIERQRKYYVEQEKKEMVIDNNYKEYGNFIWLLYNVDIDYNTDINPSDLTRLMFISTFLNYDEYLSYQNKRIINKNNMNSLLCLSQKEYVRFYKSMIDNKIFIEDNNKVKINTDYFYRGNISSEIMRDRNVTRLYINGIREIYSQALPRSHKQLSYVFKVLPYININYNILCENPLEEKQEDIIPIDINEFCNIIGYNKNGIKRIISTFRECYFIKNERILSFVSDGSLENSTMFINPNLYYAGNKWDEVKVLGAFCRRK